MTIMQSIDFCYDGVYSSSFGIYNVSLESGLFTEQFLANKNIIETKIKGNPKPYFQGIEYDPLILQLTFAFTDTWDDQVIRRVAKWLGGQTYYKPLWFAENPGRIFYCMSVDDTQIVHNGLKQGYVTLKMRCDSPYTYSPTLTKGWLDYSAITAPTTFEFVNDGDMDLYPEIWIQKIVSGDVSIVNKTDGNREFKFTGLLNDETVYVNNESQEIITDVVNTYRYSNFNNKYLKLVYGANTLEVTGKCKLNFRYQYRTLH